MKAKTTFLARQKTAPYAFIEVQIKKDRPVREGKHGTYYARYSGIKPDGSRGRIVTPLGDNIETAYVAFLNLETAQKQIRAGQSPSFTGIGTLVPAAETLIKDAVEEYLYACKSGENSTDTIGSKTRTLHSFQEVCFGNGVTTVEALKDVKTGRRVLLAYLAWMKSNLSTVQVDGVRSENTRYTRMRRLGAFLKQHGIKIKKAKDAGPDDAGLLTHGEFPKYIAKQPTKYSKETVAQWLSKAAVDEADLIWFFLSTGFRDEEVAYCEWQDIKFGERTINVHAKSKTATRPWSWKPKDDESRPIDIPLSSDFVKRMQARQKRHASQKCALIFPSSVCKPDNHLIRIVRRAAKRAGITERIEQHKIRRTFACAVAENHPVTLVQKLLGHSDIATTQLYLSADSEDVNKMAASIDKTMEQFAAK